MPLWSLIMLQPLTSLITLSSSSMIPSPPLAFTSLSCRFFLITLTSSYHIRFELLVLSFSVLYNFSLSTFFMTSLISFTPLPMTASQLLSLPSLTVLSFCLHSLSCYAEQDCLFLVHQASFLLQIQIFSD